MSDNITVRLLDLPITVRGFTVLKDDWYTIIINANLSESMRQEKYEEEMKHIKRGDFQKRCSADTIEIYAHGGI